MVSFSLSNIKESIELLRLNKAVMVKLAEDKSASLNGIIIIAVPAVLNLVFSSLLFPSRFGAIFQHFLFWSMLVPFLALVGSIFLVPFAAEKIFSIKADYLKFFRILSHAAIILWLSFIPFLIDFLGIFAAESFFNLFWFGGLAWICVVAYNVFSFRFHLNQQNSATLLAIFIVSYLLFQQILGRLLVGSYYGMFY